MHLLSISSHRFRRGTLGNIHMISGRSHSTAPLHNFDALSGRQTSDTCVTLTKCSEGQSLVNLMRIYYISKFHLDHASTLAKTPLEFFRCQDSAGFVGAESISHLLGHSLLLHMHLWLSMTRILISSGQASHNSRMTCDMLF